MSTYSLPRLLNGGGSSSNQTINNKFASLNRRSSHGPSKHERMQRQQRLNEQEIQERRNAITRRGSIAHNQFRGIKREHLERQTTQIVHSLTVGSSPDR